MTVWTHRTADKSGTNRVTPSLTKEEALSTGAEFIGEGFIFGVVVAVTAWEYQSSAKKSAADKLKQLEKEEDWKRQLHIKQTRLSAIEERLLALESSRGGGEGAAGGWFSKWS
mmetsp:Transcript_45092/g.66142  ORF Transcript_45092/g.66142 Transcript_45092/m.66142 type:complete len:113 (+) Transcript_45092:167-505(+)